MLLNYVAEVAMSNETYVVLTIAGSCFALAALGSAISQRYDIAVGAAGLATGCFWLAYDVKRRHREEMPEE